MSKRPVNISINIDKEAITTVFDVGYVILIIFSAISSHGYVEARSNTYPEIFFSFLVSLVFASSLFRLVRKFTE